MNRLRPSDEGGAISVFMVGMIVGLFLIAGLVIDGGGAITARQKIYDDVEQAARAGANEIDVGALRSTGEVQLLGPQARSAALGYLAQVRTEPTTSSVVVDADSVTVEASSRVDTTLLQLIGLGSFGIEGQATAEAAAGITGVFG